MATGTINEYKIQSAVTTVTSLISSGVGVTFEKRNGVVVSSTQAWNLSTVTSAYNNVIANIPSGFRPSKVTFGIGKLQGNTSVVYTILIQTNGDIEIYEPITTIGWLNVTFPSWVGV